MNDEAKVVRDACLRLLTGRDHSKQELLQKLTVKGYDREIVLAVIDELAAEGWQDDLRYAKSYARSRILKGYGPVRIIYELRQNGIDITRDGVYAANLPGAGAAITRDGVYAANLPGAGAAITRNGVYAANLSGAGDKAFNLDEIVKEAAGSWMALLEQVYSKKYGREKRLDASERAKRSRFLCQRGFTGSMISALFKHLNIL